MLIALFRRRQVLVFLIALYLRHHGRKQHITIADVLGEGGDDVCHFTLTHRFALFAFVVVHLARVLLASALVADSVFLLSHFGKVASTIEEDKMGGAELFLTMAQALSPFIKTLSLVNNILLTGDITLLTSISLQASREGIGARELETWCVSAHRRGRRRPSFEWLAHDRGPSAAQN